MPGRRKVRQSQLKVGVLILVALAAAGSVALLISGNTRAIFSSKLEVRAYFKNSNGLKVGAPVKLDGVTIGNVRSIRIVDQPAHTPVEVVMAIRAEDRNELLTDSRANLSTMGVIGGTEVDINNVEAHGQPVKNGAVLPTGGIPNLEDTLRSFQSTNQNISSTISEMNTLVKNLGSNKGSIGKLINDPALRNRATAAMNKLSSIPAQARNGEGTVGKFMTDDSLSNHLKDMQAKFADISTKINSGQGTAGKFMKDPALAQNLKTASSQIHQISSEVHSGDGAVAMMLKDPEFKRTLRDTGSQLSSIKDQTKTGQGTIGQMMTNPSLNNHLKELMENSRKLATGMRKSPKKYFAIRFRIF